MRWPSKPALRLFLTSFLILFAELTLIRWIPAHIRMVSYFSNIILLGSLLGIGIGLLSSARKTPSMILFPALLTGIAIAITRIPLEVDIRSHDIMFFTQLNAPLANRIAPAIMLPFLFTIVGFVFVPLAQELGKTLSMFPPLTGYTIDIIGALCGVVLFSLFAYFSVPATWWFLTIGIADVVARHHRQSTTAIRIARWSLWLVLGWTIFLSDKSSIWSPYYRITVQRGEGFVNVSVNNTAQQYLTDYRRRENFYFSPYDTVQNPSYQHILVIGAGTGQDVATALGEHPSVKEIDAVDIDPQIMDIGKRLHPNRPYDDPRVRLHITDGRAYLRNTDKTYDLIIYALPDSILARADTSNVRLESFLFTKEAFRDVKRHLTEKGLFVLYNFYRQSWVVDRIALTLEQVFGEPPKVIAYPDDAGFPSIVLTGPKAVDAMPLAAPWRENRSTRIATDDWPFLYVKQPRIPTLYIGVLVLTMTIAAALVFRTGGKTVFRRSDWPFFFLGAGFMLLETKSLVTFELLFGNTWLVNAFVFIGILLSILSATCVSRVWDAKTRMRIIMALFAASVVASSLVPAHVFLGLRVFPRFVAGTAFYFLPIILGNVIFAQYLKRTRDPRTSLGASTLGMVAGGALEYASLVVGFRLLGLVAGALYLAAFVLAPIRIRASSSP